jgi:hypothetical protein
MAETHRVTKLATPVKGIRHYHRDNDVRFRRALFQNGIDAVKFAVLANECIALSRNGPLRRLKKLRDHAFHAKPQAT